MKIAGILFSLLLSGSVAVAQEITFGEKEHDFGRIRESAGTVYHDFFFMNTGDAPLRIQSVLVSCGCTSSEWPKQEVKPGEKACIRVSYHPQGRREKRFTNVAEVYTNSKNFGTHSGVHNLYISGEVVRETGVSTPAYQLRPGKPMPGKTSQEDVFSAILERMQDEQLGHMDAGRIDSLAGREVATLLRGGKWADVDYACYFRTNWQPVTHLRRVLTMSRSYVHPDSRYCGNDTLFAAIRDALAFWVKASPKCHNWWFNQIAVPQHLGDILVLLDRGKEALPGELKESLFAMMAWPDPRKWTGANKLDIALHHLQRGCLLKNDSIVRVSAEQIFYPVRITRAEGIQPDLSYHQHGSQLYIGAYGTVFAEGITRVAAWLEGTDYALKGERLELFTDFIRRTYLNVFRGGYIDFSVMGRGVSRENALEGLSTVGMLKKLESLDAAHAAEYADAAVRFSQPGHSGYQRKETNTIYWRSDYVVNSRENFDFSVRTASVRTRKTESGNGENLCGGFLSDGATCIRRTGDEYYNIFPVWDWNKIPGVTAPEISTAIATNWGEMGKAVFSGGVSDGREGVMAYAMEDYGMTARKAWFFFGKEVVCLGAGITSHHANRITTCLNQCLLRGKVVTSKGQFGAGDKAEDRKKLNWVLHDSVLYYFPARADVMLYAGKQGGSWNTINYNYSSERIERDVFKLWIDHGQYAANGEYTYVVVPGVGRAEEYSGENIAVVENTAKRQVVFQRGEDVLQAVFYEAGSLKYGDWELRVEYPCAVMVKGYGTLKPEVLIADPTQQKKEIRWQLLRKGIGLEEKANVMLVMYGDVEE